MSSFCVLQQHFSNLDIIALSPSPWCKCGFFATFRFELDLQENINYCFTLVSVPCSDIKMLSFMLVSASTTSIDIHLISKISSVLIITI